MEGMGGWLSMQICLAEQEFISGELESRFHVTRMTEVTIRWGAYQRIQ